MKRPNLTKLGKPAIISLIVVGVLFAAGFTGATISSLIHTDSNLDSGNNQDVENQTPPEVFYNVLTGLETTSELADLRPVSICIANSAYALPQDGISNAEVLIEMPIENGGTRLIMLTTSYQKVATIGAVQSVREYMLQAAGAFGAIQFFNGTDNTVSYETILRYNTLDYVTQNMVSVYYKDNTRVSPNDLMTNGILIDNAIKKYSLDPTVPVGYKTPYVFVAPGAEAAVDGGNARTVSIGYANDLTVTYKYDPQTGKYYRYQYGEIQIDGNNGDKIAFDNLFILFASSVTYDKENGSELDLIMEDGGSGYYCTDGKYETIRWQYNNDGSMTFYDAEGNLLEVNRGTSYIGFTKAGSKDRVSIQ